MSYSEEGIKIKNQHYVPQFYLKQWSNINNKIEILDVDRKKILKPRGTKGICSEEFFYARQTGIPDMLSQEIEEFFKQRENLISNSIRPVLDKIQLNKQILNSDKFLISYLMAMLWARGPVMRMQINRGIEEFLKTFGRIEFEEDGEKIFDAYSEEFGKNISSSEKEKVIKSIVNGDYRIKLSNYFHNLIYKNLHKFANLFYRQDWKIFIAKEGLSFVTSDSPVREIFPEKRSAYGSSFLERQHIFPLSPTILIHAAFPKGGGVKRKTLFTRDVDVVNAYNVEMAIFSHKYAYGKRRDELQFIIDRLHSLNYLYISSIVKKQSPEI